MMERKKPILCLDFDGVIHSYTTGWEGADVALDPPVSGAMQAIESYLAYFRVAVFSSRSNQQGGINCMRRYIERAATPPDQVTPAWVNQIEYPTEKPPAMVTIDDRALTFTGIWPEPWALLSFKPWNK
jgi:hypothetical protein